MFTNINNCAEFILYLWFSTPSKPPSMLFESSIILEKNKIDKKNSEIIEVGRQTNETLHLKSRKYSSQKRSFIWSLLLMSDDYSVPIPILPFQFWVIERPIIVANFFGIKNTLVNYPIPFRVLFIVVGIKIKFMLMNSASIKESGSIIFNWFLLFWFDWSRRSLCLRSKTVNSS